MATPEPGLKSRYSACLGLNRVGSVSMYNFTSIICPRVR